MDDDNLNKFNHNFIELYKGLQDASGNLGKVEKELIDKINNIKDSISEEAYDRLVEDARLDWREMVDEYSDLPTDAEKGTTVGVKNDGIIYRYDGSKWDRIFEINLNPISEVDDRLNDKIDSNMDKISDYNIFPQSPKPQKVGILDNSYKIVKKTNDRLDVVQKTNKGYVHYTFELNKGADDYDDNHGLLRLTNATHTVGAYVYYDIGDVKSGTLDVTYEDNLFSTLDSYLYGNPSNRDNERNLNSNLLSSKLYRISNGNEVTWTVPMSDSDKLNIMFNCTPASSNNLDIKLNGNVVKNVNLRDYTSATTELANGLVTIEIDVPRRQTTAAVSQRGSFDISIDNKGGGNALISCFNFYELKDYNGQPINQFKSVGISKRWLTNGANDYAIRDFEKGKLFGSYHGGEVSETIQLFFNNQKYPVNQNSETNSHFQNISDENWCALRYFYIYQRTNLANNQAKMTSKFDFNSDGTIEMDFGYESEELVINSFRTAMSCTHTNFRHLTYPKYNLFPAEPTETFYYIPTTEGKITQVNSIDGLQLDLRFTRFNQEYEDSGAFIADRSAYRKFYYGPLDNSKNILLKSLSFSKGMDFTVR